MCCAFSCGVYNYNLLALRGVLSTVSHMSPVVQLLLVTQLLTPSTNSCYLIPPSDGEIL